MYNFVDAKALVICTPFANRYRALQEAIRIVSGNDIKSFATAPYMQIRRRKGMSKVWAGSCAALIITNCDYPIANFEMLKGYICSGEKRMIFIVERDSPILADLSWRRLDVLNLGYDHAN